VTILACVLSTIAAKSTIKMPIEDDKKIKEILTSAKTIAVVGASNKTYRDSNRIGIFLKHKGYTIIPVNPNYTEIDGEKCFSDLKSIGRKIDIVNVFRNPEAVDEIADEAIIVKAKTLWLQLGVVNQLAAEKAEKAGVHVIMDHCIAVDYSRLMR
jgi:uncharacterized protein